MIDYERLQRLLGEGSYNQLSSHKGWVEEYLEDGEKVGTMNGRTVSPWEAGLLLRR